MNKNSSLPRLTWLVCGCLLIFVGCAPRDEYKSVDQLLNNARSSFEQVKDSGTADVNAQVSSIVSALDNALQIEDAGGRQRELLKASEALNALLYRANYTTRPAMHELVTQWRGLATDESDKVATASVKLLAARTLTLMTSEMETTKFGLS
ncbi:MAG: hypothetical protein KDD53_10820 [Bdellovibrionales bacterium]|nr:hypothetical protein [Bdellovibrionales bacterium]